MVDAPHNLRKCSILPVRSVYTVAFHRFHFPTTNATGRHASLRGLRYGLQLPWALAPWEPGQFAHASWVSRHPPLQLCSWQWTERNNNHNYGFIFTQQNSLQTMSICQMVDTLILWYQQSRMALLDARHVIVQEHPQPIPARSLTHVRRYEKVS